MVALSSTSPALGRLGAVVALSSALEACEGSSSPVGGGDSGKCSERASPTRVVLSSAARGGGLAVVEGPAEVEGLAVVGGR